MNLPGPDLAAVVLAGGRSRRMGVDKAAIPFCGRRMIDVVVGRLNMLSDRVVVVARQGGALDAPGATVLEDERPFEGPLPALLAGMRAGGAERSIAVACDMPFLEPKLLMELANRLDDDVDAVVPVTADGPQPLHAAYGSCAIEPLLTQLAAGERSLVGALDRLRVRWIEEEDWRSFDRDGRSFMNINTPADLEAAVAWELRP
jgi:molybdopterin-guanine dinucleotide biosynthesis protein A